MGDDPAQGGAALAGGAGGGEDDAPHGQVEVGRGGHHGGVVAAELEQAAAEAGRHAGGDEGPHAFRAGGTDQGHPGVIEQGGGVVGTGHGEHVQVGGGADVGGRPVQEGGTGHGGQRRGLRRLPDHGVTADEGQGHIPRPDGDREVEGADDGDHPQRMPGLHQAVARPLGGHGATVELAGQADGEVADVDHLLDLTPGLGPDLAHLDGHQVGQVLLVLVQQDPVALHQRAPHGSGHGPPLEEGRVGPTDGDLHAFPVDGWDGEEVLAGDRRPGHDRRSVADRQIHPAPLQGALG